MRMRGNDSPEAWACRLLAKLPVPERLGSKVLPIPIKSRVFLTENKEALDEQQEPPRLLGRGGLSSGVRQQKIVSKKFIIGQKIRYYTRVKSKSIP